MRLSVSVFSFVGFSQVSVDLFFASLSCYSITGQSFYLLNRDSMEASPDALPFLPDGESFHDSLYCEKCQCFLREPCWQHAVFVQDGYSLPLAFASLPDVLAFHHDNPLQNFGQSAENSTIPSVVARTAILAQTVFGPFIAPVCDAGAAHSRTFSSSDGQRVTFDVENDRWCNWMKLVRTVDHGQHNLRVFIREQKVLFVAVKVILPGEELTLALRQRDRKEIHQNNVDYADCKSGSSVVAEDPCMDQEEDDGSDDADVEAMSVDIPQNSFAAGLSGEDSHLPLALDEQTDLLPQSQPLPAQLEEQLPASNAVKCEQLPALPFSSEFCSAAPDAVSTKATDSLKKQNSEDKKPAPLLVMRSFQREDSPEYPFPSNFSSAATAPVTPKAVDPGKCENEKKDSVGIASRQTAFARVYSLRGRNVVRVSAACSDEERDDNDEDFRLNADDESPSAGSEFSSEVEVDFDGSDNRTKNRGRKRRTVEARAKMPAKKTKSAMRKDPADAILATKKPNELASVPVKSSDRSKGHAEKMRRLNVVARINPFQFSSRKERRAAWTTAWQAYQDAHFGHRQRKSQKASFTWKYLRRYVKMHLDDFPQALDRYSEDTASRSRRQYIDTMRVIAEQAGKDYAGVAHLESVEPVRKGQLDVANDALNSHSKQQAAAEKCKPDRSF
ncbi:uncharacterized protein LOC129585468 [Paramacrobiotus metropolitanus]|uniref:uncharacterized protein LOC129585468 n=1 Tax=Paramacrobiotus metropolitanus TaxID=2943436 RepID=UPI0024463C96|nr:uncharacterized protein LOC129585468 [Paramacrobiotus metropolitanus]